ncbi:hypothetical protein I4U23_020097 [Adineta vaga]|nr:hypothetical protein I4U23_020097 [Adineta vaga]
MSQLRTDENSLLLQSDYGIPRRKPDKRSDRQKKSAEIFILLTVLFERAAFYSLVLNLVSSLSSEGLLHWSASHSSLAVFIFSGITNISALIVAVVSDGLIRRSIIISAGFVIYIIGYAFAIVVTNPQVKMCVPNSNITNNVQNMSTFIDEPCVGWILPVLVIIAIGSGAVQSNMAVFGAEQTQTSKVKSRYFDKYLIAVNVGGIIGSLIISFIQKDMYSYFIGYLVAASMLTLSFVIFLIGRSCYYNVKPYDSVVATCIPFWFASIQLRCQSKQNRDEFTTSLDTTESINSKGFTDRMINDNKSLRRAIIVFSLLIPYFLIYNQISATFPLQGEHMHKPSDVGNIVTLMTLSDPVTLIIGLLILYFIFHKNRDISHSESTIHKKFLAGMFLAFITMIIAGTMEKYRRDYCDPEIDESSLSVYYLLIQNVCMGISEVFAMLASFEYAYFAAPQSAQSLFMSFRFVSIGIASFIGSGLISAFPNPSFNLDFSCRSKDYMEWSFYTYFYILAGIQLVFLIMFHVLNTRLHLIEINPQQIDENSSGNMNSSC